MDVVRLIPGQSLTPTLAGFGNRVLVGDPLHNSARNGSTIDRFCETAVIDRLLLPFAEQLRRVSYRILYQFDVERQPSWRSPRAYRVEWPTLPRPSSTNQNSKPRGGKDPFIFFLILRRPARSTPLPYYTVVDL